MKKYAFKISVFVGMLLATVSCSKDEILADMSVAFSAASYEVAPLATVELPFAVTNAGEGVMSATATGSNAGYVFTPIFNGNNNGTVLFTAPDIVSDEETVTLTLTVKNDGSGRQATATTTLHISASETLQIAFEQESYEFIAEAGDVLTLAYKATDLDHGKLGTPAITVAEGWKAEAGDDNTILLTVPEGSTSTDVAIEVEDNFGRKASARTAVTVKPVTIHQNAANCHLIAPGGTLRFDASHKGNSADDADRLHSVSAELVWQDEPGLISDVIFDETENTITVTTANKSGNAVIATRNDEGDINWSWHIWVADYDPEVNTLTVKNGPDYQMEWTYMDRNLGAVTGDWKTIGFHGLMYQWGRKDPFPGIADWSGNEKTLYDMNGNELKKLTADVEVNDNLDNAIKNPMTFYCNANSSVADWYTITLSTHNNDLWGATADLHCKTIYDPCPYGWKVPENDYKSGRFQLAVHAYCGYFVQEPAMDASTYEDEYYVGVYRIGNGKEWYFPYAGRMSNSDGSINYYGTFCEIWTANPYKTANNKAAYYFTVNTFLNGGKCNTYLNRAEGRNVRCVKDEGVQ